MKAQVFFRYVEANGERRTRLYENVNDMLVDRNVLQVLKKPNEVDPTHAAYIPLDVIERWEVISEPGEQLAGALS